MGPAKGAVETRKNQPLPTATRNCRRTSEKTEYLKRERGVVLAALGKRNKRGTGLSV